MFLFLVMHFALKAVFSDSRGAVLVLFQQVP